MEIFKINSQYIELFKLLKASGLCDSGGSAKMFISDGLVIVNGFVETRKRCKIKPGSIVEFQKQKLRVEMK